MPKEIKGNPRRTPPEPAPGHSDIDEWFRRLMPHLQPIVRGLTSRSPRKVPGLHYAVKFKRAFYGLPGLGWIIEIAAYDVSVNVVFLGGADFDRPPPLGAVGRTRYVKVTSLDEGQRPELHECTAGRPHAWVAVTARRLRAGRYSDSARMT